MRAIRYIIFILVVIGLIWLIVLLFQSIFSRPSDSVTPDITTTPALSTFADTDAKTTMFVDGPINAEQEHYAVRITVERTQAKMEVISGYNNRVIAQQVFPNTAASYNQFLSALDRLDFTKGITDPELQDSAGACAFGNRYTYTLQTSSETIVNLWTTSCRQVSGTFQGESSKVRKLFLEQIPRDDRRDLTRGIQLSL